MSTVTIFRRWKDSGTVIALFPFLDYNSGDASYGMCMSYEHVGQHGEADYDHVIKATLPASETDYEDLADELTALGYELDIRAKRPLAHA